MSQQKPSIRDVIASVASAAFGVQTSANRERDFQAGSATPFIIGGILFTVIFIISIIAVVRLVLG